MNSAMLSTTTETMDLNESSSSLKVKQKTLTIEAPSGQLFAIEHRPAQQQVNQCVIMLNSGMVNRTGPQRVYWAFANQACQSNMAVIRVDLAGVGDSVAEIYETHFDNHRKEDVNAVFEYARSQWPDAQIILQGICAGARIAFKAAAENPDVAGLLSWSNEIYTASQNMPQSPTEPEGRLSEYIVSDTFSRTIRFIITFKFVRPSWWREQFPGGKGVIEEIAHTVKCMIKKALPTSKKSEGEFLVSADRYLKEKRKVLFAFGENDTLALGEFKTRFAKVPEGDKLAQGYVVIETGTHTFSTAQSRGAVIETSIAWIKSQFD